MSDSRMVEYPFARVADERFPLLRIATQNATKAHSVKVEWLLDSVVPGKLETCSNYTQIIRTPFSPDPETGDRELFRALDKHLEDVENTLWFGIPSYDLNTPRSTCGGVLHYLGRPPLYADFIALRPLRDLVLLKDRGNGSALVHEFLSEISLEVRPAQQIRPYRHDDKVKAWAQGASL